MIDKIKDHFRKHKTIYTIGASAGIAIITCSLMRSNVLPRGASVGILPRGVTNTASFVFHNKQIIKVITVLERSGRGHPGYPVRNLETMRTFFTQGDAAKWANASESVMSGHLKGKLSDVHGLHFERVSLPI